MSKKVCGSLPCNRHVGVFVATENGLEVVVVLEEGAVVFIHGNEGRIARPSLGKCQRWVAGLCRVHLALGRTPRNEAPMEAVVKQARTSRHPWLISCDTNMDHTY